MDTNENQNMIDFKISHDKPPIYAKCHEAFGVNWDDGIVITYGDTVYCKFELSTDLIVHERVHVIQQKEIGVEAWWDRYLADVKFRLQQEVEAYREQIKFIKKVVKDRNLAFKICHKIWQDMERMYGGMCDYREARRLTQ